MSLPNIAVACSQGNECAELNGIFKALHPIDCWRPLSTTYTDAYSRGGDIAGIGGLSKTAIAAWAEDTGAMMLDADGKFMTFRKGHTQGLLNGAEHTAKGVAFMITHMCPVATFDFHPVFIAIMFNRLATYLWFEESACTGIIELLPQHWKTVVLLCAKHLRAGVTDAHCESTLGAKVKDAVMGDFLCPCAICGAITPNDSHGTEWGCDACAESVEVADDRLVDTVAKFSRLILAYVNELMLPADRPATRRFVNTFGEWLSSDSDQVVAGVYTRGCSISYLHARICGTGRLLPQPVIGDDGLSDFRLVVERINQWDGAPIDLTGTVWDRQPNRSHPVIEVFMDWWRTIGDDKASNKRFIRAITAISHLNPSGLKLSFKYYTQCHATEENHRCVHHTHAGESYNMLLSLGHRNTILE
jgi:hypothetical protein